MACEMFWIAAEEPPPAAVKPKGKAVPAADAFACDTPDAKPAKQRSTAERKPRRRAARRPKASAAGE